MFRTPPRSLIYSFGILLLLLAEIALAVDPVEAVGLFKDRAMLKVQGVAVLLRVGQTSPQGARLLKANAREAVVSFSGETYHLTLSQRVGGSFIPVDNVNLSIPADSFGQYRVKGSIDGQFVSFLVDTGASVIAMSERHAQSLGIDYRASQQKGRVLTANGEAESYNVILNEVTVGGIQMSNVKAAVIRGSYPVEVLLGMSFLSKVGMQNRNGVLRLHMGHE